MNSNEGLSFASRVIAWQKQNGRHDLPWQNTRDPYRIWLSEVMLQQTQVATALRYYARFLRRFPSLHDLASADEDEVLSYWQGLGYYSRGRNLHKAAQLVARQYAGKFPNTAAELVRLPGVGRSTAAAIAVFANEERVAILDGNVKRVLARHVALARDTGTNWERLLWRIAEERLPNDDLPAYTQGLMDLGATVCTSRKPACAECPVAAECRARIAGRVEDYPGKLQKRSLPTREWRFVAVVADGKLLLERRPARGIWPALWCLPQWHDPRPPTASDAATLSGQFSLDLHHTFTHFKLNARIFVLSISVSPPQPFPNQVWAAETRLADLALPAPISRVMPQIFSREHVPRPG